MKIVDYLPFILYGWVCVCLLFSMTYLTQYPLAYSRTGEGLTAMKYLNRFLGSAMVPAFFFLLLGGNIDRLSTVIKKAPGKYMVWTVFYLYIGIIIYLSFYNSSGILGTIFTGGVDNGYYLSFADSFTIFSVFFLQTVSNKMRLPAVFLVLIGIFKIGSRTSLLCFIIMLIVSAVLRFISAREVKKTQLLIGIIIFPITLFLAGTLLMGKELQIENPTTESQKSINRMLTVFSVDKIENDGSVNGRKFIDDQNMADLNNVWVFGRVFREIELFSDVSRYSHNIKSYLIEFGIGPFVLIIVCLLLGFLKIVTSCLRGNYYRDRLAIEIYFVWIIAGIFSRSYVFPITWLLIGIYPSINRQLEKNEVVER